MRICFRAIKTTTRSHSLKKQTQIRLVKSYFQMRPNCKISCLNRVSSTWEPIGQCNRNYVWYSKRKNIRRFLLLNKMKLTISRYHVKQTNTIKNYEYFTIGRMLWSKAMSMREYYVNARKHFHEIDSKQANQITRIVYYFSLGSFVFLFVHNFKQSAWNWKFYISPSLVHSHLSRAVCI